MKVWEPWVYETQKVIIKTARWIFAALILNFLILANVGAVLVIINQLRKITE